MPVTPYFPDITRPLMVASEVLEVSEEQQGYLRALCEVAASDSQFADKLYLAIMFILTSGSVSGIPVITELDPDTAELGSDSFTLSVIGTGFTTESIILWNGAEEPTTYVSPTEITTGVNMATAEVAIAIPVQVWNSPGVFSNEMTFTLTEPEPDPMIMRRGVVAKKGKK